jgi:hypothetical protein
MPRTDSSSRQFNQVKVAMRDLKVSFRLEIVDIAVPPGQ